MEAVDNSGNVAEVYVLVKVTVEDVVTNKRPTEDELRATSINLASELTFQTMLTNYRITVESTPVKDVKFFDVPDYPPTS